MKPLCAFFKIHYRPPVSSLWWNLLFPPRRFLWTICSVSVINIVFRYTLYTQLLPPTISHRKKTILLAADRAMSPGPTLPASEHFVWIGFLADNPTTPPYLAPILDKSTFTKQICTSIPKYLSTPNFSSKGLWPTFTWSKFRKGGYFWHHVLCHSIDGANGITKAFIFRCSLPKQCVASRG